jgi:hypothetical protein
MHAEASLSSLRLACHDYHKPEPFTNMKYRKATTSAIVMAVVSNVVITIVSRSKV